MGIPLRVLLDKHDRFLPETVSEFYCFIGRKFEAFHYHESEVIWHAVSEERWDELETYLKAFEELRNDWKDFYRLAQVFDPLVCQIEVWTGLYMHRTRKNYIEKCNKKFPGINPPLRESDNLAVRLAPYGGLPSWAPVRRYWLQHWGLSFATRSHPGHLSNDEIKHFRRKGVHFGLEPVASFKNVVDTRAEASTEVLGLAELLPDSKLAETAKAVDDLSNKSGQHCARTSTLSHL